MSKTILTKEQEQEIIQKYNAGTSKNALHLEYKVSEGTIRRALRRNNITIRQVQGTNISHYYINSNFFEKDKITRESAYVLGLLASDGNVARKENCVYIELNTVDIQLLIEINQVLENEREVKTYSRKDRNDTSKLYFFSRKIVEDLAYFNIIPNKTYANVDFAEHIPDKYFFDFIRGYFDGDGCITKVNSTLRWQLDGVSLSTFQTIQSFFKKAGIELKIRIEKDKKSTMPKYRLYCYSKKRCEQIFELLYANNPSLKMERKYKKFLSLLNE